MTAARNVVVLLAALATSSVEGVGCRRAADGDRRTGPNASAPPASTPLAPAADPPGTYMGRALAKPMSYWGADWLDREDRETTEQPEHVLDVLALREGSTVADVGAGSGYFTVRMAKRVGPRGRVLATDLQPEMLTLLRVKVATAKLGNVVPVLATESDSKLPRGELDLVLMVDVYHELQRPQLMLRRLKDALSPRGRLVLVEFRKEDPSVPIRPEHKMSVAEAKLELEAEGYRLQRVIDTLPWQHLMEFVAAR